MGIRFNKSIKLGSLLKLNISKSGISATVGPKGASINLGKNGTYLNLSPTIAGITGTGLSYRQKITGGYGSVIGNVLGGKKDKEEEKDNKKTDAKVSETTPENKKPEKVEQIETKPEASKPEEVKPEPVKETNIIDEYKKNLEANINIHKYVDNVISKEKFAEKLETLESDASKQIYQLLIDGDEDTIESYCGAFLNNLDLNYEVSANYELEDHILYVDLDLPEIETFEKEYPCIVKNEIVKKAKTSAQLKEEYGRSVLSLGIYVAANFFNVSSYVEEVILSGFTTKRNKDGDLADEYLYSIKFLREEFEKTDLSQLEDTYQFLLKFENRINMNNYTFKAIKPYEMASVSKANSIVDDAVAALKELGYKQADINRILPKLSEGKYENTSDCVKAALQLFASNN